MQALRKFTTSLALGALLILVAAPARAEVSAETQYVLNSFSFLMTGALVMWMAAGFAMLEAGLAIRRYACWRSVAAPAG